MANDNTTRNWSLKAKLAHYTAPPNERGCEIWTGRCNRQGYGELNWKGATRRVTRLTWEEYNGPIPPGMFVCHKCDVPSCRSLEHLFLGTPAENSADRDAKGRHWSPRGAANGAAKLTDDLAMRIYQASGPIKEIGKQFGISFQVVSYIKNRKAWRHIHAENP